MGYRLGRALLLLSIAQCAASSAFAQTTGRAEGAVRDATTNLPVAGASIVGACWTNPAQRLTVASADGRFELLLPPGSCHLDIQAEGYHPFTWPLEARLGETAFLATMLMPDGVYAEPVNIDIRYPQYGDALDHATLDGQQLAAIPYGRDTRTFDAALTSVPGAIGEMPGLRIHGAGLTETAWSVEGMNVADPIYGGLATPLLQDFIEQVSVDTEGVGAAFDSQLGPRVSAMLKSGTNEFHGSVFAHLSPYEAPRAQVSLLGQSIASQVSQAYNFDVGGTLGGPLLKDRLWFFAGFAPHVEKQDVARIIQARTDNGSGGAQVDSTGTPITQELARDTYGATQTTYEYVAKLDYALSDSQSLSLAAFGNFAKTSGAAGTNLAGNEGTFLRDTTANANDFVLRYSGRFNDGHSLVDATAGFHTQRGSIAGGNASPGASDDSPLIVFNTTTNLLNPTFTGDGLAASQTTAAVRNSCAIHADGFNPCPVSGYATGGPGYSQTERAWRAGGSLSFAQLFEFLGHHRVQVGAELWHDGLTRYQDFSGGREFIGEFQGSQLAYYEGFGYGHANPSSPATPEFNPNRPGHLAGDSLAVRVSSTLAAAFAEETWSVLDHLTIKAGLRVQSQTLDGSGPNALDLPDSPPTSPGFSAVAWLPRFALRYDVDRHGALQFNASYSRLSERVPLDVAVSLLSAAPAVQYGVNASNCTNLKDPRTCAVLIGGAGGGRTYVFDSASGTPAIDGSAAPGANEWQAGARFNPWRDLVFSLSAVYESFDRPVGYLSNDQGCCRLGNPGSNYPEQFLGSDGPIYPGIERKYLGGTLAVQKTLPEDWFLSAAYTLSRLQGNEDGLLQETAAPSRPAIAAHYDLNAIANPNQTGPLPANAPSSFKLDGSHRISLTAKSTLHVGAALRVREGTPTNYLGAAVFTGGAGTLYILPAGSGAALPWLWQLDARVAYQQALGEATSSRLLEVSLDIFNLTDNRGVLQRDQRYTYDSVQPIVGGTVAALPFLTNTSGAPIARNPGFGQPTLYQLPLSLRFGAKLSF